MKAVLLFLFALVLSPAAFTQDDLNSCMRKALEERKSCGSICVLGGFRGIDSTACLNQCTDRRAVEEDRCRAQDDRRRRIQQEQARFQQEQEDRRRRMEQNTPKPSDAESFNGPGSNQDFAVARYQCFKETQQIAISASRDALGSSTSAGVQPSCAMFNACLAAKGYERVSSGRFNVTPDLAVKCSR